MPEEPSIMGRRLARSGNTSYTAPIVIRSSKATHFELVLQYVHHTSHPDELAPKLVYWKKNATGFRVGFPIEFTLTQSEAEQLRELLSQGLTVAESGRDGNYLLLPLDDAASANLSELDSTDVGRALAALLSSDGILNAVSGDPEGKRLLGVVQAALRIAELEAAVDELEQKLSDGVAAEGAYQDWCEKYNWVFGNAYTMRDDVRNIALGDQVDLLLSQTANGLRDIIELKRPDKEVILYDAGHKSWYWSSDAAKAIGQCHRYLDALHEAAAHGLRDHPELVAYHPKATIVIGRSNEWTEDQVRALHGLNARLHGVQIITFDHLLAQAKEFLRHLRSSDS